MNFKTIFKSLKNKEMRKRLLTVIGIIAIYRILAHVPVPIGDNQTFKETIDILWGSSDFGSFLNLVSGGTLSQITIIAVGISPYISAQIVMQLLSKAIPSLEENSKEETGRRKINQITRILTVPVAIIQSIGWIKIISYSVIAATQTTAVDLTLQQWALSVTALTAGSVLMMWLGELITEQGVGNGISTIILCGIVTKLPEAAGTLYAGLTNTTNGSLSLFGWLNLPVNPGMFWVTLALIAVLIAVLYLLVKINEAQRVLTINYAKRIRGNSTYGGIKSILPMKVLSAGVIPVIFAVALLSMPALIGQLILNSNADNEIASKLVSWFTAPNSSTYSDGIQLVDCIYPVVYFALIVLFTYFYTNLTISAEDIAESIQQQGGFIEGVRPGKQTEKYISKILNNLNLFGATALGVIAMLPYILDYLLYTFGYSGLNITVTGTGLLIVVSVALENLRNLNSRALMVIYDDYK